MALASTALATPALARDNAWYVGAEGGAMIVEDIHFDIGALKDAGVVNHHYGYDVDGTIGYDFGMFRLEAEVGYKSATVDSYRSSTTTPATLVSGRSNNQAAGTYNLASWSTASSTSATMTASRALSAVVSVSPG
jgi:OOP family OmpA-OmpF porin